MHRGGTSAIARGLETIGVHLGDNLLPAGADNPKGFWEDVECIALNEELLAQVRSAYDRLGLAWRFSEPDPAISALKLRAVQLIKRKIAEHAGVWGFKDPRTSRLVPFWREVVETCGCTASYVIALRNPLSVALSFEKRNQIPAEKCYFLWLQHMLPAVLETTGSRRAVVDYDLLMDAPVEQLSRLASRLGLEFTAQSRSAAQAYQEEFLERGLRHTEFAVSDLAVDSRVPEDVIAVHGLLSSAARDEVDLDAPGIVEKFNAVNSRLRGIASAFSYANALEADRTNLYLSIADYDRRGAVLQQSVAEREREIAALNHAVAEGQVEQTRFQQVLLEREGAFSQALSERDRQIADLSEAASQREAEIGELQQARSEADARIAGLKQAVSEREGEISALGQVVSERDARIAGLEQIASRSEGQITSLYQAQAERDTRIAHLQQAVSARDAHIAGLQQEQSERDTQIAGLNQVLSERGQQIASLGRTLAEREEHIASLDRILSQRGDKIESLKATLSDREALINSLQRAVWALKDSMSWRVTAPLRSVYEVLMRVFGSRFRPEAAPPSPAPRPDSAPSPAEPVAAAPLASVPVGSMPDATMPDAPRPDASVPAASVPDASTPDALPDAPRPTRSAPAPVTSRPAMVDFVADYVEDSPPPPHFVPGAKLVAFYLPQFHAIPENDGWWGKGFTEWTNVTSAASQFHGHYQPHLPGELGFYDLRVEAIQARQVELAKRYGIGAFCFYSYWFGGKRLLELPVRQYLDNPRLDLPFCLCWANENWTRRWDGLDEEVLIAQNHSPADDIAFIEHVAEYMRDPRYLRVNGRPVLLVYRPSLLPDVHATAQRWREWARRDGLGELYLIYPQSFETCDPADYGFDAATEFPPNLCGPPILTDSVELLNPKFAGTVYDWRILVERSRQYSAPSYKLFRGVCPSWDSEPRRSGRGTVFVNATPDAYREWLENAVADTRQRLYGDERLIFVNAWNEWAEGAHLEPDRRYGYAWLRATREAVQVPKSTAAAVQGRVVVVTHDAHPHGGQYIALNVTRELASAMRCEVEVVCLGDGPLKAEFAKHGRLHDLSGMDAQGPEARQLAADLFQRGFRNAIVNTTVGGLFLGTLKQAGLHCVALVHELREIIVSYRLQAHASTVAEHADSVVFPAEEVRDAFSEFAVVHPEKSVIRPQGLLKHNAYAPGKLAAARRALREELGLPEDARAVLAVGYADRRKGVDYFVDIAAQMVDEDPQVHFVWVGHGEADWQRLLAARAKQSPGLRRHVHFIGRRDNTDVYYAGADVFALTSREDPFPCVVLEAMDAGLPVVAFQGSGGSNRLIQETGGDGVGVNVPMGDTKAFADAIRNLLADSARRETIGRRGQAVIAERFSLRQYAFDLLALAGLPLRKVSVVLPNYNYERYLADRIATILNQTYPIYEVIFLDDASRDNSVAVARGLLGGAGVDYRIVANEDNSGSVFRQWKLGAELARGDVVWLAEADDLSHPDFLAAVLKGFDDPEVVLSYCESKQIDREGRVLADNYHDYVADLGKERWKRPYVNAGEDEIREYLAVKNTIPNVSAAVIRRDELTRVLCEHIEDICSYKVAGDWKTYLHLLPRARLAYVPQALNLHRRHLQGVTIGSVNEVHFREIQEIQGWVASRYALRPRVSSTMRRYLDVLRAQFGLDQNGHGAAIIAAQKTVQE
ncbi:MAG TPA: glycoside hydrolase family 99-like domain-containing protein [Bryobacteraceae bacterium]|nr:glycoside hydrolase family 99-like domain-containing protein [Bryobacteraceae bacterium]